VEEIVWPRQWQRQSEIQNKSDETSATRPAVRASIIHSQFHKVLLSAPYGSIPPFRTQAQYYF
jgi:hypothetical protein